MMLVKTDVQPSAIHGLGLFATDFIAKGTCVWEFTAGFDHVFSEEKLSAFPEPLRSHLACYSWKNRHTGQYCYAADNAKYFNHADKPNTRSIYLDETDQVVTIALVDILPGEELTDDYQSY